MSSLQYHLFPALSDNYGVLMHCPETGQTASIDAPEAAAVEKALELGPEDEETQGLRTVILRHVRDKAGQ